MMIWAFYPALKPIQEKRHIQLHNLITLTNCRTFVCNRPSSSSSDVSKVRVAYQGIPGAYSEAAALKAYLKSETLPCEQFEAAFKGTEAVQGISISMFMNLEDVQLGSQVFMKMYYLRTLIIQIYGDQVHLCNGGLDYLPEKLKYLYWERYPLDVLPSSFNPKNLVELDLSHSKIKQLWEGSTCVPKLKWLRLVYCSNLISIPDLSNIPLAEIINLNGCRSLIEIHSSRECPKNLHSLNLSFCRNLSSFPSNIHLSEEPSFSASVVLHSSREDSEFSLRYCFSLTKFPDIPRNIKRLDLRYSGVEEVRSTIQSLSKLESLDMSNCTRLKRISESICKLKSLDRLDLSGCCKLESFPDILEGMELKHLDLSGTAIKELPLSIGNLNWLEELVLSDSKLEKLPPLSELPSSLRYLEAMDCTELMQSLPDESEIKLCADGCGSSIFNFLNCLKLNQKAVRNLFRDSVLKMQLMGTEKIISLLKVISPPPLPPSAFHYINTPHDLEEARSIICLPGSEIPEWFSCYKNNGSSINIPGLRNDCVRSSYIMGFEVCLVIGDFNVSSINIYETDTFISNIDVYYDFHIETSDGHKEGFVRNSIQLSGRQSVSLDHILLGYNLSRNCYEFFQELDTLLANRGMSDYVGTSFKFNIRRKDSWSFIGFEPNCKVKYCGIQPIYISGCNDTAEETCEPHPKGICTEAKDFEGFIDDNSNFNSNNNNNCKETAIEDLDLELHIGHSSFYDAHMNSVSINQNTGDTSGCNDIAEETCEPHPKRICTEANQFS
ncbi:hypothetical protein LWI29_038463 [Acer saccharum]|uniref:Uncharacterized protein n=1 Tax=Acer saccharum TaxID=4024 RepID=A0AA39VHQ3_ACESA|nr:hypothetical protein LWI29_038463 [Acer saccharum]